jgi:hypothetical protein
MRSPHKGVNPFQKVTTKSFHPHPTPSLDGDCYEKVVPIATTVTTATDRMGTTPTTTRGE